MNREIARKTLTGAVAFISTAALSTVMMNSLPRVKEQRQRSFERATIDGNLRRMRWLHFAGAKINVASNSGTPLFLAAGEGNLRVVRYLLDEGADVNARAQFSNTPLTEAVYNGSPAVIKELLLRGADVNAVAEDGTALDVAIKRRNAATAELLRHHGGKTLRELRSGD
jgi:ankyrin repeat protein